MESGEVPQMVLTLEMTCPPMVVAPLQMTCHRRGNLLRIEEGLRAVVGVLRGIGMGRVVGVPRLVVSQVTSKVEDTDQRETSSRTITDKMVIIPENTLNRSK